MYLRKTTRRHLKHAVLLGLALVVLMPRIELPAAFQFTDLKPADSQDWAPAYLTK